MNTIAKTNAALYRNLQILLSQKLENLDIGVGQYDFFYVISQKQGRSQQELSDHLMIGKSTTTKVLSDLENKGYIKRARDKDDGRIFRIYLTPEGEKILPRVNSIFKEVMDITIKDFNEEEVDQLKSMLDKVLTNVVDEVNKNE